MWWPVVMFETAAVSAIYHWWLVGYLWTDDWRERWPKGAPVCAGLGLGWGLAVLPARAMAVYLMAAPPLAFLMFAVKDQMAEVQARDAAIEKLDKRLKAQGSRVGESLTTLEQNLAKAKALIEDKRPPGSGFGGPG